MSYVLPLDPTAIETAVGVNADAISANSTTLSTHGTRLNATETATTTNANNIATNTSNITSNDSDISALQSTVSGHTTSIGTNTSNISSNATNISTNASNISTNTSDISTINAAKGAANGFCPLDGSSEVPLANLKNGVANGLATLDGTGNVPLAQLGNAPTGYISGSANDLIVGSGTGHDLTVKGDVIVESTGRADIVLEDASDSGYLVHCLRGAAAGAGLGYIHYEGSKWEFGVATPYPVVTDYIHYRMGNGGFFPTRSGAYSSTSLALGENSTSQRWTNCYLENAVTIVSDRKLKKNVKKNKKGLKFLRKIKTRQWKNANSTDTKVHRGLVAQELEELLNTDEADPDGEDGFIVKTPEKDEDGNIVRDENGDIIYNYGVRYGEFIGPLITAVQELADENEGIKARLAALEKKKK